MARRKVLSDAQVIAASARALLRVGPSELTLAEIGRETGLSPATLLQRFGSKNGLLLEVAKTSAREARAPFEAARRKNRSPLSALRAALISTQRQLRTRQAIANSVGMLLIDLSDEAMRAQAVLHARATEQAICELLDEAVTQGELSSGDTHQLALSVQAAWNGAIIQWALRGQGAFAPFLMQVLAPLLPETSKK